MNQNKTISVLVFTCDRREDLKRCLDSLLKQTYANYEIMVIDNSSSEATGELLKKYPVKIIKDTTKKLSYLFNIGWKNVDNEIIAYIADDAEADSRWLENIAVTFENYPNAGAVGGPTISSCNPAGEMNRLYDISQKHIILKFFIKIYEDVVMEDKLFEPGHLCESGAYSLGTGIPKCLELKEPITVDLLTTTNMGIKQSVLQRLNGFDENFIFNHADGDLFVRIKKSGYKLIFSPNIIVTHHVRLGPSREPKFIGRDTAYFLLKDIRPKTIKGYLGFFMNIMVLNLYWIYKTIEVKDVNQLRGISGFFIGIYDYFKK